MRHGMKMKRRRRVETQRGNEERGRGRAGEGENGRGRERESERKSDDHQSPLYFHSLLLSRSLALPLSRSLALPFSHSPSNSLPDSVSPRGCGYGGSHNVSRGRN